MERIDGADSGKEFAIDSKQLIYEGFNQALAQGLPLNAAGILVNERFGAVILRDARQRSRVTALSVERSGADGFEFEYGADFAGHIEAFDPAFAKVLVRCNPQGDPVLKLRQLGRLEQLSGHCWRSQRRFMFELLVPPTDDQLARAAGNKDVFDRQAHPLLMQQTLQALQDGVPGSIGFAVGRTSFWDAVSGYRAQTLTRAKAAAQIAGRQARVAAVKRRVRHREPLE